MFVSKLDVLGWGRGGLQGLGSSVVGMGEEIVSWDDPMGLTDVGSMGGFESWGGGLRLMSHGLPPRYQWPWGEGGAGS